MRQHSLYDYDYVAMKYLILFSHEQLGSLNKQGASFLSFIQLELLDTFQIQISIFFNLQKICNAFFRCIWFRRNFCAVRKPVGVDPSTCPSNLVRISHQTAVRSEFRTSIRLPSSAQNNQTNMVRAQQFFG